ncbi:hypothetical protein P4562_21250 [Lysinibacillus xylanilyticus]|uniref:type II secretion system F family protein n=1 Tax=Lysinibacillus xylanilyticus TaxID=582475 RepID=UPI002E22DF07|nr:hypothetical protein [Lysinibacillus xylanilyticus]
MNITLAEVIEVAMLLLIAFLAYSTLLNIKKRFKNRKFILGDYVNNVQESKDNIKFLDKITSLKKYKEYLSVEIEKAYLDISVEKFLIRRMIYAVTTFLLVILLYVDSKESIYLYISLPIAFLMYKLPKRTLKRHIQKRDFQLKVEIPNFLYNYAVLLESYPPYEATKQSIDYAGPIIKPHVEHMVTQINLYPASNKPFHEFADNLKIREVKEFVTALEQIMKVDSKRSTQILKDQIKIMDKLQAKLYEELVKRRPEETRMYANIMLWPMFGVLITILILMMINILS